MSETPNPPLAGWSATGELVDSLDGSMDGAWLVTTQGSHHLYEIHDGSVLWTRIPGNARDAFVGDAAPHPLTRVARWPAVGDVAFVWFDDPQSPMLVEQWRRSSTIVRIERVERDDRTDS